MQLVGADALDGLAQQTAADSAQPRAADPIAQGFAVCGHFLRARADGAQRADALQIGRLVVAEAGHGGRGQRQIEQHVAHAGLQRAGGHLVHGGEQALIRPHVAPLVGALAILHQQIRGIGFPEIHRAVFRLELRVLPQLLADAPVAVQHQRVDGHAEALCDFDDVGQIRRSHAALPFLDRLPGDLELFGQPLLREIVLHAQPRQRILYAHVRSLPLTKIILSGL